MKTLFISLLRLGDLLMHLDVVKAYSKQNPNEEIFVLANEEFSSVVGVFPRRIQFLFFPRHEIQKQIVDRSYHFRFAYEHVSELISFWNKNQFHQVINLTHNRSSAYIAGIINANFKKGLRYEKEFCGHDDNRWWRYLNYQFSSQNSSQFNYKYILKSALGLQDKKRILIHPFSNDSKKNWPLSNFIQVARELKKLERIGVVEFVGTSQELQRNPSIEKEFICRTLSLSQLREELMWCDGLLAVDSSIKHLALSIGLPVVEVAVGSASPTKYADSDQSFISSNVSCFPCNYSKPCPHAEPLCHSDISILKIIEKIKDTFELNSSKENPNGKHAELSA